jgi:glycosyltransferase involved in cell wall biosynthesis
MRLTNALVTRPMLAAADPLVFISASARRDLLGDPPRRACRLLFNGVNANVFHPQREPPRATARQALCLPNEGALALFVGRFVEKKGLAIIEVLARRRPGVTFLLVGAGPIRPENWALPNVRLLGPKTQPQLAELYRAADLLLLPSVGEGYPLVIQEAMACGLPVICGEDSARADPDATPWLRGVAIDLADPSGSAARCAGAIDSLLLEKPDSEAMAAYAARAYSWRAMAATLAADLSLRVNALHHASSGPQP